MIQASTLPTKLHPQSSVNSFDEQHHISGISFGYFNKTFLKLLQDKLIFNIKKKRVLTESRSCSLTETLPGYYRVFVSDRGDFFFFKKKP